jgi:hypothetical protein
MNATQKEVARLFDAPDPIVRKIYDRLLDKTRKLGDFEVETKKTCVHLARDVAFAGVHPRASGVLVNIKTATPIRSARVRKLEQASKSRYHNEILLTSPDDVNSELLAWVADAYALADKSKS